MKVGILVMTGVCLYAGIAGAVGGNANVLTMDEQARKKEERAAREAKWLEEDRKSLETAYEKANASGKRIFLLMGADWCGWCITLKKSLTNNVDLASIMEEGYIHADIHYQSFKTLFPQEKQIRELPNISILSKDGKTLKRFNPVSFETKNPRGYDTAKLAGFLKEWFPGESEPEAGSTPTRK